MARLYRPYPSLVLIRSPFETPEIGLRSLSGKIDMHDVQIVAQAPHLQSTVGEARFKLPVIAHRDGPRRPARDLIGTFCTDERLAD